jgi:transcriptional regulator of arginine metabolism
MPDRDHRRALIRRLLQEQVVSSQEELASLLAERGVVATQATLSRDLRDMGVTRRPTAAGPRYALDPKARYMAALRKVVAMEIQDVKHNGHVVVVRTLTGRAEGVGGFLDGLQSPDILGTIAGDDTVLVVPADITHCSRLAADILALTGEAAGETEGP